jgi:uncharacterized protein
MLIRLRVHPSAKKDELTRKAPDLFEVRVRAPAEGGRANSACLALVAAELGIPAGRIRIVKGGRSPSKIIEVP